MAMSPDLCPSRRTSVSRIVLPGLCGLLLVFLVLGIALSPQPSSPLPDTTGCSACDGTETDDEVAWTRPESFERASLILPADSLPRLHFEAASISPIAPPPKSA